MELTSFINKAKKSKIRLWLLNRLLYRLIPFNKPHGLEIMSIADNSVSIKLPYRRKNHNHIRGLHACALATLAEYTTGFMMITKLNPEAYRIIMQRIEMDYHYQGKSDAHSTYEITPERLQKEVEEPLKSTDSVIFICEPKIIDARGNHLATGKVYWQVKSWDKVRTKL